MISTRNAFKFARSTFNSHYKLFIAVMLTFFGSWVGLEVIVIAGQKFGIVLWIIAHLAFFILFAGLEVGFIQISLALYDGQEVPFSNLYSNLNLGFKFLIGQIIYLAISLVGFVFFIIPGLYLGTQYAMFGFCLVSNSVHLKSSFKQSGTLSKGSKLSILLFLIIQILINLLGASLLGIGLLITVPLSVLMMTSVYRQLENNDISRPLIN